MPGQAIVTIGENQWTVDVASTYLELVNGLRGVTSLSPGTGMLFQLSPPQAPQVDTTGMNFNIDIVFIANNSVLDIVRNVAPGYLVTEETPCDYFLEVNAEEAASIEVDEVVNIELLATIQNNISDIMAFAIPLVMLGFVSGMVGGIAGLIGGGHSSKPNKETTVYSLGPESGSIPLNWYEKLFTETINGQEFYRVRNYFPIGWPDNPRIEMEENSIAKDTYRDWQRRAAPWTFDKWRVEVFKTAGQPLGEHHSISGEPRRRLVDKYGSWAVGRAEAVCPEDDIACVTREAKRLYETIQARYGEEVEYVTIISPGQTVFHIGDVVSIVALEKENKRVRDLGLNEATYQP